VLWPLDAESNRLYLAARQRTDAKALAANEAQWRKARDACGSNQVCLKTTYQSRIEALRQIR
jgi:uncharacterized protein